MSDVVAGQADREGIIIRVATRADIPGVVRMLADDPLGAQREQYADPLPKAYLDAFDAMQSQPGNDILVAELGGAVVGCLQLTLIPGLSRLGMTRAQIEGVRVDSQVRGRKIGELLMRDAIARSRAAGAALVQLTTDISRPDAHRFYEGLGFVRSHAGMKLSLD
ncbi:MAG: GNAT family N-acetyltransferase [Proteobacteria bacterium]|jgi:ribosomal protein S18 acetylase RimI-like enzyme|nr:GNAT family N-acetyltransferase [Pseudomonadota bacterium]